jgi:hypothetical protein
MVLLSSNIESSSEGMWVWFVVFGIIVGFVIFTINRVLLKKM